MYLVLQMLTFFIYMVDQTLECLTLTKSRMHDNYGQREYPDDRARCHPPGSPSTHPLSSSRSHPDTFSLSNLI
jgi:hypothetical protein